MRDDRETAFLVLRDIETKDAWSNLALNARIASEKPERPAFVRELVYGVLRQAFRLDHAIQSSLTRPGAKLAASDRVLLRMGFYEIACMGGAPDRAVVHETVELAKRYAKGRDSFINAVLRDFLRRGGALPSPKSLPAETAYSCAPWIADLWRGAYGAEKADDLMRQSNEPAELAIRVNLLKTTRKDLAASLQGLSEDPLTETAMLCEGGSLLDTQAYLDGLFSVQSRMSQLAVACLAPMPDELVADLCAAPGGKACAMAEAMQNRGTVHAFDLYEKRTALIDKEAERLGLSIVRTRVRDTREPVEELIGKADRVLCDVPCSGLGTIRRRPEIKLRPRPKYLESLRKTQTAILANGAALLKPGGRLLYATCTMNPAENEAVTGAFLAGNEAFKRIYEKQFFPEEAGDGFYLCLIQRKDG